MVLSKKHINFNYPPPDSVQRPSCKKQFQSVIQKDFKNSNWMLYVPSIRLCYFTKSKNTAHRLLMSLCKWFDYDIHTINLHVKIHAWNESWVLPVSLFGEKYKYDASKDECLIQKEEEIMGDKMFQETNHKKIMPLHILQAKKSYFNLFNYKNDADTLLDYYNVWQMEQLLIAEQAKWLEKTRPPFIDLFQVFQEKELDTI